MTGSAFYTRPQWLTDITDFRTGEATSTWTDSNGTWTRRAFASEPTTSSYTN
ncbi:hypothetical protein ACLQ3D_10550 [Micromonospora vinacea]|uniref:hypothetical protein n=1 Tax=Micromonospora TaxID=1873 RepID=UPI00386E2C3D|nr:hypothetical protein OH804_05270 [Micromonospora sp. NBC_00860]WTA65663.1 hypothetical protein OHB51_24575 [Micromonospora sp. NBC_00855]